MIPPVIYTKVSESDRALVARAAEHGLSDLHESLGRHLGRMTLMHRMRPLCPRLRISGRAITAYNYPGDNLMMHKALQLAQAGADGRKNKESEVIRALKGGATLFDVFNGEATLKARGIAIKDMTGLEDEKLAH